MEIELEEEITCPHCGKTSKHTIVADIEPPEPDDCRD
jgi:hypothetical protein